MKDIFLSVLFLVVSVMMYGQEQCLYRAQPADAEACLNDTAVFAATVDTLYFEHTFSFEWLYSTDGGSAWTVVPPVDPFIIITTGLQTTLKVSIGNSATFDDYMFKCRVSGTYESESATLQIHTPPSVSFEAQEFCFRDITRFANTSEDEADVVSWVWELSDNTTYFAKEINHSFPGPGEYTVKLSGTNDMGCTGSTESPIMINELPQPEIRYTKDVFCSYESNASFYTPDNSSYVSYLWMIEGQQETIQSDEDEIVFDCDGNFPTGQYKVTLTVSDDNGCYNSTWKNFLVLSSESPVDGYVTQKENDSKLLVLLIEGQELSAFRWLKIHQETKDTIIDMQTANPYHLFDDAIETQTYKYGVEVIPEFSDCSALFFLEP